MFFVQITVAKRKGQGYFSAMNHPISSGQRLPPPPGPIARFGRRERCIPNPKLKFMEQCREVMRFHRLALRTEKTYLEWIRRFIHFNGTRHPQEMGVAEVRAFLTHLAAERNVAASTQNQALNALLFLYRHVLDRGLEFVDGFEPGAPGAAGAGGADQGGDGALAGGHAGHLPAVLPVVVWNGDAADGGVAAAGEGFGF